MGGFDLVGELYDYMIGIVVVGVIFTSAVFAVPAISYVNLLQVDQQQLRNTALNVFNAMLLGTGCPVGWGSTYPFNQCDVESFGLDYSQESSMYVLDTDKVQRLDKSTPAFIEYEYARERLGLKDYGFVFTIFRPFTVESDLEINSETCDVWFAVNVSRSEDGRPLPNAEVSCTILVALTNINDKTLPPIIKLPTPKTYFTNALGRCEGTDIIDIDPETEKDYKPKYAVAILTITVAGISTMVVEYTDEDVASVMKINTYGDTITLSIRDEDYDTSATRWVRSITSFDFDSLTTIYERAKKTDDKFTHGIGWWCWNRTFPGLRAMDPALLLFTIYTAIPGEGFSPVIVAGPFSLYESYEIFSFGPETGQPIANAIKLRRYVVISGMTYIAELELWKE
jgi:hypothetical protein